MEKDKAATEGKLYIQHMDCTSSRIALRVFRLGKDKHPFSADR
jgi:hypothetical protein